jgi:hypothetical protein
MYAYLGCVTKTLSIFALDLSENWLKICYFNLACVELKLFLYCSCVFII